MSATIPPSAASVAVTPFARILAVCAPDQAARKTLALACDLARAHGATLTVLSVADHGDNLTHIARHAGVAPEQIEADISSEMAQVLKAMTGTCGHGLAITHAVRFGRPFHEIIDQVIEAGHDLVVKQAEPFDDRHRFLFTSTDQHLIRKCPCPVWLMQPDRVHPGETILAAIDLDETGDGEPDDQLGLNRQIVGNAIAIAAFTGATLHVCHVWDAPAEDLIGRWSSDGTGVTAYVNEHMHKRQTALEAVIADARAAAGGMSANVAIVPHLVHGQPRDMILAHVEAVGAGLLVIGTIARSGIPGLIIGNIAEDVLNVVECPVLTIKPPGYVSPFDPRHR